MARPETVKHSRIRRDCEVLFCAIFPVAGSPHGRGRSMSKRHGETCLRYVRSGEQGRKARLALLLRDVLARSWLGGVDLSLMFDHGERNSEPIERRSYFLIEG